MCAIKGCVATCYDEKETSTAELCFEVHSMVSNSGSLPFLSCSLGSRIPATTHEEMERSCAHVEV
jgi:hypothetical protein